VILDGSLLCIDRVAMASGNDRPYYSGKHKVHGLNVQVIADPRGRLIWISPPLPGARHDIAAAREHAILTVFQTASVRALGGTGYRGAGPAVTVPQRLESEPGKPRALAGSGAPVPFHDASRRGGPKCCPRGHAPAGGERERA
jgi:hypothetical protein